MEIKSFSDRILLPNKKDVLRVHLYTKLLQHGIKPYKYDIEILIELYCFGGYNNSEEQSSFFKICLDKGYKRTIQSVRNTLSTYTTLKVLDRPRNSILHVNKDFIPQTVFDKLVLQHMISHAG